MLNHRVNRRIFSSALLTAPWAATLTPAAHAAVAVGQAAPDFSALDTAGKPHRLSDYKGKLVVLEWTNPGCPFVQKHYSGNMQGLQKEAVGKGVVWLAINSTETGSGVMTIDFALPHASASENERSESALYRFFRAAAKGAVEWTEAVRRFWRG